jgi:hypothetical protein
MSTAEDLRRLERIATEYSTTKEDILAAAQQVVQAIVKLCADKGTVQISYDRKAAKASGELQPTGFPNYWIENGRLLREVADLRRGQYVSVDENRTVALLFAEDISKGLLGHIYENLGEQNAKSKLALGVLKTASKILTREEP